ncbi:MAG: OB-fold nucleic acid binding domain-containing protein, partial [Candidatus Falkowbacteria bacterium]|nr:OB-fold nucleic acid binding domain-containing protein [Candidatus Falkowbacteria bacterium]
MPVLSERAERLLKLKELNNQGINAFPAKSNRTHNIQVILANFKQLEKTKEEVKLVGRIMSKRAHGNLTFAHLLDGSGKIQVAFSKKDIGMDNYKNLEKLIDIGDFLEVSGSCFITHKGENSIMAKSFRILAKAIRPLPEKWHGLKDEEELLRKRYLDILFNPETKKMIEKRAIFWQAIRTFMINHGFLEVETPVLEVTTGGADARPFITHHNALDMDLYLRISTGELWQKRLMVAGLEKTFEIGRQFRNEGMDTEHLQDYTQMEFYWAYADYEDGMKLVAELYKYIAQETFGTLKFKIKNFAIDLGQPWERFDYQTTVLQMTGIDILKTTEKEIKKKLDELKIEYDPQGFNLTRAIDNLWKFCRKQITGPGFLVGIPVAISPLAKRDEKNPELTQRFQLIIA